jgi:hypothetical protein
MKNLVLITSVINTPNTPLSYISNRSIYTKDQRFEQTKKTILSIKDKIPDAEVFIVECSDLNEFEETFFKQNSNYFLNLHCFEHIRNHVYGISKSLGEGTMTYHALEYIHKNNINYDNLIKISGRYLLSDNFDLNNFVNESIVIKYIDGNGENVFTALYKLPHKIVESFRLFLHDNFKLMFQCIGYERLFAKFIQTIKCTDIKYVPVMGLEGPVSVSTDYYIG